MKVWELREALAKFDPDDLVVLATHKKCVGIYGKPEHRHCMEDRDAEYVKDTRVSQNVRAAEIHARVGR